MLEAAYERGGKVGRPPPWKTVGTSPTPLEKLRTQEEERRG